MLTSPAAHTWACLCFPTTLTSRLSATENALFKVHFVVTHMHIVLLDIISVHAD